MAGRRRGRISSTMQRPGTEEGDGGDGPGEKDSVLKFMPGVVCGGSLTVGVVKKRSKLATEDHLARWVGVVILNMFCARTNARAHTHTRTHTCIYVCILNVYVMLFLSVYRLKESKEFKAWERGGDLLMRKERDGMFEPVMGWVEGISSWRSILLAAILVLFIGGVLVRMPSVLKTVPKDVMQYGEMLEGLDVTDRVELKESIQQRAAAIRASIADNDSQTDLSENEMMSVCSSNEDVEALKQEMKMKHEQEMQKLRNAMGELKAKVSTHVDALETEMREEKKRYIEADRRAALAASAAENYQKQMQDYRDQLGVAKKEITSLEDNVRLSLEHSSMLKSADLMLLCLECILVIAAGAAYLKGKKLQNAYAKARKSYLIAYRRQQGVLAAAEDVYAEALRYKSEAVDGSKVHPGILPESWTSPLRVIEDVMAAEIGVQCNGDPEVLAEHLESYVAKNKIQYAELAAALEKANQLESQMAVLLSDKATWDDVIKKAVTSKDLAEQKLILKQQEVESTESKLKKAFERVRSESARADELSWMLQSMKKEKDDLLAQKNSVLTELDRAKGELGKVTMYATSLEELRRGEENLNIDNRDAGAYLAKAEEEFCSSNLFSHAIRDELNSNGSGRSSFEISFNERLSKIRKMLHQAQQDQLEPLGDLFDSEGSLDTESAVKGVPNIAPLHFSSSDEEDSRTSEQALKVSKDLSEGVENLLGLLRGIGTDESLRITAELEEKKTNAEKEAQYLQRLSSQLGLERSRYKELKLNHGKMDYKSDQEFGKAKMEASHRVYVALENERDACERLGESSSQLAHALEKAEEYLTTQI